MPGYVRDRAELARWLASGDIYVSGMADETFGISIIEAQASGLPVVGVAAGAMIDRVTAGVGRLGRSTMPMPWPPTSSTVWTGDRAAMGRSARACAAIQLGTQHGGAVRHASIRRPSQRGAERCGSA